jgi:protein-S-isoprenylcysteine O-methyltransferase Ste14
MAADRASPPSPIRLAVQRGLQVVILFAALSLALLLAAGRLDWWEAWAFLGAYFLISLTAVLSMVRTDPQLSAERAQIGEGSKGWDKAIIAAQSLLSLSLFVVIGLDAGRFGWSHVPPWLRIIAVLGMIPAFGLPAWASKVNTYLSGTVRIQSERGHRVVSQGPYRWIRHPMYAGMVVYDVCVPLLLGSWWGLVVGSVMIALVFIRTALEDRTLQAELPGYAEYAQRVRYRLLPGIW